MYIIYITRYRKKVAISCAILILWFAMFAVTNYILHSSFLFKVTVDDYLVFSYPLSFQLDDIFVSEKVDTDSIRTNSAFGRPDIEKFSDYNSVSGGFSFQYPSTFLLNQQNFSGSDILYHVDFHSRDNTIHGFVQVWNMPYSLKQFLDNSKNASQEKFTYFNSKEVNINNVPGFYWDYTLIDQDGVTYRGNEVFLQKDGKMYRISYFVPEKDWDKTKYNMFWSMVRSFKTR